MKRVQSSAFDGAWINHTATEEVDPRFADLDAWSLTSAMETMWEGQLAAVAAIGHALPAITAATVYAWLPPRNSVLYVPALRSSTAICAFSIPPLVGVIVKSTDWPPGRNSGQT